MAQYDITAELCNYLDNHMIIAILDHALDQGTIDQTVLLKAKIKFLEAAKFFDEVKATYEDLGEEIPEDIFLKEQEFNEHNKSLTAELEEVKELFSKPEVINAIKVSYNTIDPSALIEEITEFGFKTEMLDTMFKGARAFYDVEKYDTADNLLYNLRPLTSDPGKRLSALWGRLAVEIMLEKFESAKGVMDILESNIRELSSSKNKRSISPGKTLKQRAWLMHWSLFIFFLSDQTQTTKLSDFLDHFMHTKPQDRLQDKTEYVGVIQTVCPHMIRYFASAAIITSSKRTDSREALKDIVRMIRHKTVEFSDPITSLLESVYVHFDFEKALEQLKICETVLDADFFLKGHTTEFVEAASKLIFEAYCRIHSSISIKFVSERLDKSPENAEKWIVDLIQSATLSARIEQTEGYVKMLHDPQSTYDQVLESTRSIPIKTRALLDNIGRMSRKAYQKKREAA